MRVPWPEELSAALQEEQAVSEEGRERIREVWGVVADYYLDARRGGFNQGAWAGLRDKYLAQPLPSHEAAYRSHQPPCVNPSPCPLPALELSGKAPSMQH